MAPKTSLGWSFVAVQWLDILWVPLVLLGIEKVRIVPGFLAASPLDLYYMPWTHSLAMALVWSWLFYRVTRVPALGLCVFSHWVLDFIAHWHDLPLWKAGPYVGLGLWRSQAATFGTEAALLVLGLLIYLRVTRARSRVGRWAMPLFVVMLILINIVNIYGKPPSHITTMAAILAENTYFALACVAAWLDRLREPIIADRSPARSIVPAN